MQFCVGSVLHWINVFRSSFQECQDEYITWLILLCITGISIDLAFAEKDFVGKYLWIWNKTH